MPKLIMTYGLPASGKSTWAKEYIALHPNTKIVNKDQLRLMLDNGVWNKQNENFVLKIRDLIITQALKNGFDIICDDTNLALQHKQALRALATNLGAQFEIKDFSGVPLEECIARDQKRPNYVGEKVIRKVYRQFLASKPKPIPYRTDLPDCYIFDVDGTLAKMNGRGAYEWDKVNTDVPNKPVIDMCLALINRGKKVIFVSGRDSICAEATQEWISKNVGITVVLRENLFMRAQGDMRDDRIVKKEIYDLHIYHKYNVLGIFDDRDKVVKMWRSLGLTCFQVAEGDF